MTEKQYSWVMSASGPRLTWKGDEYDYSWAKYADAEAVVLESATNNPAGKVTEASRALQRARYEAKQAGTTFAETIHGELPEKARLSKTATLVLIGMAVSIAATYFMTRKKEEG